MYSKKLLINHINVNSWTSGNELLRQKIINYGSPDIVCITETHLRQNENIALPGFIFYGLNRKTNSITKGSGGIGILVGMHVFDQYDVNKCFEVNDNVLGLVFKCKHESESFVLYCVYLPPENSRYSENNELVLNNLTIEIFRQTEVDNVIICGDFNARIGKDNDIINCDSTDLPERAVVDLVKNRQGDRLLSFIKDIKGCIVNGRKTPELNDFTSVTSHKGKSVVDYFIVRQCDLTYVKSMKVKSPIEIVDELNAEHYVNDRSHIPDHSLLMLEVEFSTAVIENLVGKTLGYKSIIRQKVQRNVGANYMNTVSAHRIMNTLISDLSSTEHTQVTINDNYSRLTTLLLSEAGESTKSNKRREHTKFKEYWDDDLSSKWKNMKECERVWRLSSVKGTINYNQSKENFHKARRIFDKSLKRKRRQFFRGQLLYMESCNSKNPNEFWKYIRKLGPTKRQEIPCMVEEDGVIKTDKQSVLDKWRRDFESLYDLDSETFDKKYEIAKIHERPIKPMKIMQDCVANAPPSFNEVSDAIDSSKMKKAVGINMVANELLKHENAKTLVYEFLKGCFTNQVVPDQW